MIFDRVLYKGRRSIQPPEHKKEIDPLDEEKKKKMAKKHFGQKGTFSLKKKASKEQDFDLEEIDKEYQENEGLSKHTIMIKACLHFFLVIFLHYYCLSVAYDNQKNMKIVPSLMGFYFLFSMYLFYSAL